jgi:4-hydroxy-tetrahydrodipicolinate synthase
MLPRANCLIAATATPITSDFHPDLRRLSAHAQMLLSRGCDGIALFGTTGEGAEFSTEDRIATLNALVSAGIHPARLIVSVSALAMADVVALARHAADAAVHGILLMPPCVYRDGITEDGTVRYYSSILDQISRPDLRLYLYHFPAICGVPITSQVVRRLDERYAGLIAGVKDSGGDLDYTQDLIRQFPHLSIFTGTEIHIPEVLTTGAAGTICGLANLMPRLLRAMIDLPTAFDQRPLLPHLVVGDMILSRHSFIPSIKAVIAGSMDDPDWRRVLPPMTDIPIIERQRLVSDFLAWDAGLHPSWQSLAAPSNSEVVELHRA